MIGFFLIDYFFFNFSAQMLMKSRLAGAQKGHGLLKKKADALQMRFRMILGKIIEVSLLMNPNATPSKKKKKVPVFVVVVVSL